MEITANTTQEVLSGNNVLFSETVIPGNCSIIHREGSGLISVRGISRSQCRSRFKITFNGNLKADASESVSGLTLLSLAIAINGEPLNSNIMTVTVADTISTYNVSSTTFVDVPTCCCETISIKNITPTGIMIDVINPNLIIERVA